jgi:hypothetical protein
MRALEVCDAKASCFALLDQLRRRIETRQIVQHPGYARLGRVDAVTLREHLGAARYAHAVRVAFVLTEMLANAPRQLRER